MRRGSWWMFTAVVVAIACGCEAPLTYKQPPVGSYTAEAHQMKIGEAVTSVQGATVTLDFFGAAEIRPLLGRFFTEADRASSTSVVVLSRDLWAERFGSSPSIIGREIELDGRPTTVVGVAPRGFRFPEGTLLWTSE